jgi:hypothetical protein
MRSGNGAKAPALPALPWSPRPENRGTTAIFSVVYGVPLRPLSDADRMRLHVP